MAIPVPAVGDKATAAYADAVANAINGLGVFGTYTPQLLAATTNPTLGTGSSVYGHWVQIGKLVIAQVAITFGTSGTNAGSGVYSISLPATPISPTSGLLVIGTGRLTSAGAQKIFQAMLTTGGNMFLKYEGGSTANASNTLPGAWTASDALDITFVYEAA